MEEFQTYSPEEVILSNLEELFQRGMHIGEQERAHLRELAHEIASDVADNQTLLTALPDHRLQSQPPDEQDPRGAALTRQISNRQKALLCIELGQKIPSPETFLQDLFPPSEDLSEFARNRISYQKNSYTEQAFLRFSKFLQGETRASYAQSFPSVCEDVFNGVCEYCILPIENSSEGRLISFARLITRYGLKISATCDVKIGEEKATRFALLRKHPEPIRELEALANLLEFSCPLTKNQQAEDLLAAANICGLIPRYINFHPTDRNNVEEFHGVFQADTENLFAYLLYLIMEFPTANLIGFYPNIS